MLKNIFIAGFIFTSMFSYVSAFEPITSEQLLDKYQQWLSSNEQSYQFLINKQCFCAPEFLQEFRVSVVNDKVIEVIEVHSGKPASDHVFAAQRTISEWYELSVLAMNSQNGQLKIKFDENAIYPSSIYIDQHVRRADDEYTVYIRALKPL